MDKMHLQLCLYNDHCAQPTNISSTCHACFEDHHDNKQGYKCDSCKVYVHKECINVKIPSRHKHPLELKSSYYLRSCHLCESNSIYILIVNLGYNCSQCDFSICIPCARNPLVFNKPKSHEHELHQTPIKASFTCDAYGLCTTSYPCICHECCFIIHRRCMSLPRVININRHDHRISHVFSLGVGKWSCEICGEHVNGDCGAYSCLVCPYVVHSGCATMRQNWDGRELEGVPEEEESKPFKVIGQNLIKHFSHKHNLKEGFIPHDEGDKRCYACTLQLYSEPCYECTQCDFILHDGCANLPRKKRHPASSQKLTLGVTGEHFLYSQNYFCCGACLRIYTGFAYFLQDKFIIIDVRCALISAGIKHESHPHFLFVIGYLDFRVDVKCKGCGFDCSFIYLRCNGKDDCGGFTLCFKCATLPTLLRHKYDEHPLSLCYGEKNVNATYCCGICEEEIHSIFWFYKCNDCGSTLHTNCVFGNLMHSSNQSISGYEKCDLLPNNHLSRPICSSCKTRCMGDYFLKSKRGTNIFFCCSCGCS